MIIFTDLDGTLLDYHGYTWEPAADELRALRERGLPLVFCSSKTRMEQQALQAEIGIRAPIIVENGSAVVVPRGYFVGAADIGGSAAVARDQEDDEVVVLGVGRDQVLAAIREVRERDGVRVRGYSDMTVEEVMQATGLTEAAARRAREREFSETVEVEGGPDAWRRFQGALRERNLHVFGGGPGGTVVASSVDKGVAVRVVLERYRASRANPAHLTTAAIGDGANDEAMLRAVDRAFLVEGRAGGWISMDVPGVERVEGRGPVGWARAVERLLREVP